MTRNEKGSYDAFSVKAHGKYQYEIYYINVPEFLKGFSQNIYVSPLTKL